MSLRPLEWANMQKKLHSKDFQAITLGWGTSPDVDFYQLWHSTQADIPKGSNYVGFRNPEADKIIEDMELEFDIDKRIQPQGNIKLIRWTTVHFMFQKEPHNYAKDLQNVSTLKVRPYFDPKPVSRARVGAQNVEIYNKRLTGDTDLFCHQFSNLRLVKLCPANPHKCSRQRVSKCPNGGDRREAYRTLQGAVQSDKPILWNNIILLQKQISKTIGRF